jgi:hypothetical protein
MGFTAVKAFAGVVLLIGWIVCVRAAYVSLGLVGVARVGVPPTARSAP